LPKRGILPPFGKACLPAGRGGEEGFYETMSLLLSPPDLTWFAGRGDVKGGKP